MAKKPEAEPSKAATTGPAPLHLDDSEALVCYANFSRVTHTPEEIIIDFGLNPQPVGGQKEPMKVSQRIVTNFFMAKRLLNALVLTIKRHESAFGQIETDVQKRLRPSDQTE